MFLHYSCVMNNNFGSCPLYEYVSKVIIQNSNEPVSLHPPTMHPNKQTKIEYFCIFDSDFQPLVSRLLTWSENIDL